MRCTFLVLMALVLLAVGCQKTEENHFFVLFEQAPELLEATVYCNGEPIGAIVSSASGPGGTTRLVVAVDRAYLGRMADNVVFLAADGRLRCDALKAFGEPLPPGARLRGFRSKAALYWFKARHLLGQPALAATREAETLSRRMP